MPKRLNIGFNQGPTTLYSAAGKYGILRPNATLTKTGTTPPPPSGRRYFPDWYTVLEFANLDGSNGIPGGGTVTGSYPGTTVSGSVVSSANPCTPGVTAISIHVNWNQLENSTGGNYTTAFTLIDKWITQCRGLSVAAGYPVGLFIIIATRSFGGSPSVAPNYLDSYGEAYSGTLQSGWQTWRWSPFVLKNFQNLCIAIGNRYDNDPNWAGIVTQESATGGASGRLPKQADYSVNLGALGTYTGNDTYSAANFVAALIEEQKIIASASPHGRGIAYLNSISGGGLAELRQVGAGIQPVGSIFSGPDLVTDLSSSGLVNGAYPAYNSYHNATNGVLVPGLTAGSIQQPEWSGTKAPPQHPPVAPPHPTSGFPTGPGPRNPSIPDLFNYATSSHTYPTSLDTGARDHSPTAPVSQRSQLNVDIIMVNYVTGKNSNGDNFQNAAAPMMLIQRGFGTVAPNP